MNTDEQQLESTRRFERELGRLIAESFADGAAVEDTWSIAIPPSDAPNWEVRISKTYSDDDPPYEPRFLED